MTNKTYYYPHTKSFARVCCLEKIQAEGHRKREGGELITVPTFETEKEAQEWIKQKEDSDNWDIDLLEKTPYNPEVIYCVTRDKLQ